MSPRAAAFDPFEDEYQQNPPECLRWARESEPVFWSPKLGYWVVTRYDDIRAVFRDNIAFSPCIALEKITPTGPEANTVLASYDYAMNRTLVNEDEPAHLPRRRLLMEPFTPAALAHHEPLVRALASEYVDRFVDAGRADLVEQMLWEVPLTVALHFLGVPEEDMDTLRRYSIAHTVNTWGRPKPQEQVQVAHAVGHFWRYAGTVLEKMRRDPDGPGWMRYGIRMQRQHPEVVTDSYLHSMMMAGIVAAHETTANASANAIRALLEHPAAWRELCTDPALIPGAVEECLRHDGSVAAWRRQATRDVVVGGVPIPAGAKLLIVLASANHDPARFPDPDVLDIHRDDAVEHLTFGYGSHQCMGKNLARMEIRILLEELTRRLPHLQLAPQRFSYVANTSFRGPEHLWVQWDPARNPERADPSLRRPRAVATVPSRGNAGRLVAIARVQPVADSIVTLELAAPDGGPLPAWSAGAHVDLRCAASDEPARWRSYSLCGEARDGAPYRIAVLRETQGRGGSAWLHAHAKPGVRLRMRGPRNRFELDERARAVILIAGGIGITPIAAMARRAAAIGLAYELHYSGRSRAQMAWIDELAQEHGTRLHLHVSQEGTRADYAALLAAPRPGVRIHACGPQPLLGAIESACTAWDADALRVEHFVAAPAALEARDRRAFEAELRDSGLVISVAADQTLLAALRAANVDVPSDCEEGLCGTCEVRVLGGAIEHCDAVLSPREREAGDRLMSCCSRALGARIVLAL